MSELFMRAAYHTYHNTFGDGSMDGQAEWNIQILLHCVADEAQTIELIPRIARLFGRGFAYGNRHALP